MDEALDKRVDSLEQRMDVVEQFKITMNDKDLTVSLMGLFNDIREVDEKLLAIEERINERIDCKFTSILQLLGMMKECVDHQRELLDKIQLQFSVKGIVSAE